MARLDFGSPAIAVLFAAFALAAAPEGSVSAQDEWISTGPRGGVIASFAVHPSDAFNIYVPVSGALYHTIDGGVSWEIVSSCPAEAREIRMDPSTPTTLYVLTTNRLHKSVDAGSSWTDMAPAYCFALDERYPARMFIGGSSGIVRKSVDGGSSWTEHATGSSWPISAIAVSPADSNTVYAGTRGDCDFPGDGVFKTTNGGLTWQSADAGIGYTDISGIFIDPVHPDTLFASTSGGCMYSPLGLFRSMNGGASWSAVNTGLPGVYAWICGVEAIPGAEGSFNALADGNLYRSDDCGETWIEEDAGVSDDLLAMDYWGPGSAIRFFGGAHGLWLATPWFIDRFGIVPIAQTGIAIDPNDPDILYTIGDIAYKSTDRGETWTLLREGATWATGRAIAIDPHDADVLFVGDYSGPSALYRSLDAGATWDTCLADVCVNAVTVDPVNVNVVYAGGLDDPSVGGLFKSTDGGDTWSKIEGSVVASIAVHPSSPSTVYLGTHGQGVKKSADGGATWTSINDGLPADLSAVFIAALAIDPLDPGIVYCGGTGTFGIYKSTNGGDDWVAASEGLPWLDVRRIAVDPLRTAVLYAATFGYGVFRSVDGARTWEAINAGLPSLFGADLAIDPARPNHIYLCNNAGLFRYESSFDPLTDGGNAFPPAIDIHSFPNPFSSGATVEYRLERRGDVRLKVYDVGGREVLTLVDGPRDAGRYAVKFQTNGLSPGVYFLKASIEGRSLAKKCVVIK